MRKTILALLAALPLSLMAAYVELNITPLVPPVGTSYYYMLMDQSIYSRYDFNDLLAYGDGNLNSITRSAIIAEGTITQDHISFTEADGLVDGTQVYSAVFTPSPFGIETLYVLSNIGDVLDGGYLNLSVNEADLAQPASTLSYTIPEPTSGLLVLVGASMLALKRRRA